MADLGKLVEARFPPPDREVNSQELSLPAGFELLSAYPGPPAPLIIAIDGEARSTWVSGRFGHVRLPWGPVDDLNDQGAYARLAEGLRSDPGGLNVHVRLVGQSVRSTKRWLEINAGGVEYVFRNPRWSGPRLERDGQVVAKRFGGGSAHLAVGATDLDGVVAALVWASLGTMLRLPNLPPMSTGPGP